VLKEAAGGLKEGVLKEGLPKVVVPEGKEENPVLGTAALRECEWNPERPAVGNDEGKVDVPNEVGRRELGGRVEETPPNP